MDNNVTQVVIVAGGSEATHITQTAQFDRVSPNIEQLLKACRSQVENTVKNLSHKYNPALYVNRAIETDIARFLDDSTSTDQPHCFVIVAPAGSGKTNLLCNLAPSLVEKQPVLILLGSNCYLGPATGLLESIKVTLEAPGDLDFHSANDAFRLLGDAGSTLGRSAVLLIDAINEHEDPTQMRKAIQQLIEHPLARSFKIVMTCRDYYWSLFKGVFGNARFGSGVPEEDDAFYHFETDEHERALGLYLGHYRIVGCLAGNAVEQCRHPLLLRFFCEAYRGQDIGNGEISDIRLKELFDRYWDQKIASIAEHHIEQGNERLPDWIADEIAEYLLHLASFMFKQKRRNLLLTELQVATGVQEDWGSIRSLFGRIRNEYIILETKIVGRLSPDTVQVAFVYEEFMEYVMARSLISDWTRIDLNQNQIVAEIETLADQYPSFDQIIGVMVYVALMLKEVRDISLWWLLFEKGPKWQTVVVETIRKLPADRLDAGVFTVLNEMLVATDDDVKIQALDLLKNPRVGKAAPAHFVELIGNLLQEAGKIDASKRISLSRRAALALGNLPPNDAVPFIASQLSDSTAKVRENAKNALIRIGAPAVDLLRVYLENAETARHAKSLIVNILVRIGDPEGIAILAEFVKKVADPSLATEASEALYALVVESGQHPGARSVDILLALESADEKLQIAQIQALVKLGDKRAVPYLMRLFRYHISRPVLGRSADLSERKRAQSNIRTLIEALCDLGDPQAVGVLGSYRTTDEETSLAQIAALVRLGHNLAVLNLVGLLRYHISRPVRGWSTWMTDRKPSNKSILALIQALGKLREPWAMRVLGCYKTTDEETGLAQVEALVSLGDKLAVPYLVSLLEKQSVQSEQIRSRRVTRALIQALGRLGDAQVLDALGSLKAPDEEIGLAQVETLVSLGDKLAVPYLVSLLEKQSVQSEQIRSRRVTRALIQALGKLREPWAMRVLGCYKTTDEETGLAQVEALVSLGDKLAVPYLVSLLEKQSVQSEQIRSRRVTRALIQALGRLGDAQVLDALGSLKAPDEEIGLAQVETLVSLGDKLAVPYLIQLLADQSRQLALEESRLPFWRTRHNKVTLTLIQALGRLGNAQVLDALGSLKAPDEETGLAQVETLVNLGDKLAVPYLTKLLRYHIFRSVAHRNLGAFVDKPNDRIVLQLIQVLGKLGDEETLDALGNIETPDERNSLVQIWGLERTWNKLAVPYLTRMVAFHASNLQSAVTRSDYFATRAIIVRLFETLGRLGDPGAVDSILSFDSRDQVLSLAQIQALGALGGERAVAWLTERTRSNDVEIRDTATSWLNYIVGGSRPPSPAIPSIDTIFSGRPSEAWEPMRYWVRWQNPYSPSPRPLTHFDNFYSIQPSIADYLAFVTTGDRRLDSDARPQIYQDLSRANLRQLLEKQEFCGLITTGLRHVTSLRNRDKFGHGVHAFEHQNLRHAWREARTRKNR